MRISDWSSDVCSSDLNVLVVPQRHRALRRRLVGADAGLAAGRDLYARAARRRPAHDGGAKARRGRSATGGMGQQNRGSGLRSEEQTSELQSLMRISYAVFCLKNKHKNTLKALQVRIYNI